LGIFRDNYSIVLSINLCRFDDNYYYLPESVICKRLIEILKP